MTAGKNANSSYLFNGKPKASASHDTGDPNAQPPSARR